MQSAGISFISSPLEAIHENALKKLQETAFTTLKDMRSSNLPAKTMHTLGSPIELFQLYNTAFKTEFTCIQAGTLLATLNNDFRMLKFGSGSTFESPSKTAQHIYKQLLQNLPNVHTFHRRYFSSSSTPWAPNILLLREAA